MKNIFYLLVFISILSGGLLGFINRPRVKRVTFYQSHLSQKDKLIIKYQNPIERKIALTFPEDPGTAIAIAHAESGLNPNAVSSTNDYGLMQINIIHKNRFIKSMFDINENLRVAREIYDEQGWSPWSTYLNKSYLTYL